MGWRYRWLWAVFPDDLEDMIHVITASVKNHSVVTRTWLNISHVPDVLIEVSKQGITVHDIATIIQVNATSIPPLDRGAWLLEKAYQAGVGRAFSFPILFFFRTAMGWNLAAKTWGSNTRSASVSLDLYFPPASVVWQSSISTDQSTEKNEMKDKCKRLNQQSPGFVSVCLRRHIICKCFSFSFWLFPVHREPECFLVHSCFPCHLAGCTTQEATVLSVRRKRTLCWISFMEEKRGCRKTILYNWQERSWDNFSGQRQAAPSRTQQLPA